MNSEAILASISRYLRRHHVLTLCAGDAANLWCANSFYIYDADIAAFDIMTPTDTRHAQLMRHSPQVAGTVSDQQKNEMLIQGVQFRAEARLLQGAEAHIARDRYNVRFALARRSSAPLWRLTLTELKMTDNRLRFGACLLWQRDEVDAHSR
ncbi:YhbP family protein [Lonsdalea quercina]|uniref:YhbP family protein n=1 Tax=Lonsdalea quercina TaxID=71657 RepID=UPI00397549FD